MSASLDQTTKTGLSVAGPLADVRSMVLWVQLYFPVQGTPAATQTGLKVNGISPATAGVS